MTTAVLVLLVCQAGGAGTTAQAQPIVNQFVRQLEQAGGWPAQALKGNYQPTYAGCVAQLKAEKPALAVMDLGSFLRLQATFQLHPVAHMGGPESQRYHLLVRKGELAKIKDLAGKTVLAPKGLAEQFIHSLVWANKLEHAKLRLKSTRRPLKGIRDVERGKADATLIDQFTYEHLAEVSAAKGLQAIFHSQGLPNLTLAVVGQHTKQASSLRQRLAKAVPQLCRPEAKGLCDHFGVKGFQLANEKLYAKLASRYRRGKR